MPSYHVELAHACTLGRALRLRYDHCAKICVDGPSFLVRSRLYLAIDVTANYFKNGYQEL